MDGRELSCEVLVDNVTKHLTPHLQAAVRVQATLWITYRQYVSSDLSEPKFRIANLWVNNVTTTPTGVRGTCKLINAHNRKFPNMIYNLDDFKGLKK